MLVASQKQELRAKSEELERFNNNLQAMVDEKTRAVVELQDAVLKTMAELVEYRDNSTDSHVGATQRYLKILMDGLVKNRVYQEEAADWDTELILQSAQLHDVGKIAIEDSILLKTDELLPEEYEKIKSHTLFGEKLIENIKKNTTSSDLLEQAQIMAVSHHEKWNGAGYPKGLQGTEIPLQGRLMAIADVYDALISKRTYNKSYSHEEASKIISQGKGTHFDPILVDVFLSVSDEFRSIALQVKS